MGVPILVWQLYPSVPFLLWQVGAHGSGDGLLIEPTGVAVTADGHIVVADYQNHRVQIFDEARHPGLRPKQPKAATCGRNRAHLRLQPCVSVSQAASRTPLRLTPYASQADTVRLSG